MDRLRDLGSDAERAGREVAVRDAAPRLRVARCAPSSVVRVSLYAAILLVLARGRACWCATDRRRLRPRYGPGRLSPCCARPWTTFPRASPCSTRQAPASRGTRAMLELRGLKRCAVSPSMPLADILRRGAGPGKPKRIARVTRGEHPATHAARKPPFDTERSATTAPSSRCAADRCPAATTSLRTLTLRRSSSRRWPIGIRRRGSPPFSTTWSMRSSRSMRAAASNHGARERSACSAMKLTKY